MTPAVAGLQEVWRIAPYYDQPARLGELTGMAAVYHNTHTTFVGQTGNLLLTCGTVHSAERFSLGGRREERGCLVADVETAGVRFTFAVTHLSLHACTRRAQMQLLVEHLSTDRPLVLVGDFNCEWEELKPLSDVLTFTHETPKTFPSIFPFRALDHIGYSAHWRLENLIALPSLVSDHRPLLGDLRLIE